MAINTPTLVSYTPAGYWGGPRGVNTLADAQVGRWGAQGVGGACPALDDFSRVFARCLITVDLTSVSR